MKSTSEIKESTWQGNIVSHRLNDSSLELQECFNWSTKWRSAPTYTICGINEIVQQLARTLVSHSEGPNDGQNSKHILQTMQPTPRDS